jgi:rfaE bifunctional protein kinase chain/domain
VSPERFESLRDRYASLRVAVVGDFCLDRYLEIDPERKEISIETGLPVFNVVNVRAQPGGAGTIINNLAALGVGTILPLGFCGIDGEGYELLQHLKSRPGVSMDYFIQTPLRRTFTYCKPLIVEPGKTPRELNRFDSKNWTPTQKSLQDKLTALFVALSSTVDAVIILDQVDVAETGVVTQRLLATVAAIGKSKPELLILADSRRGLNGYPPVCLKMNRAEFAALSGAQSNLIVEELKTRAVELAKERKRMVFITAAEAGMIAASPAGEVEYSPALPLRGEIDVVGAGDAVTANLASSLAAGATLKEALHMANTAASIVIHQLGTTGTATLNQIEELAVPRRATQTVSEESRAH